MTEKLRLQLIRLLGEHKDFVRDHRPDDREYLEENPDVDAAIDELVAETDSVINALKQLEPK